MKKRILAKLKESCLSILPITAIVFLLNIFIPFGAITNISFGIGSVLLIIGLSLFSLGADISMIKTGTDSGNFIAKHQKLWLIILIPFILGLMVTIAEPDLMVLAGELSVNNWVIIIGVGVGVGIFLVLAMIRVIFKIDLRILLLIIYSIIFILGIFVPNSLIPVGFDSGGVTTGPMTVPFIMAFGIGVASISSGSNDDENNFGYIALCSAGPILIVLIIELIETVILKNNITVATDNTVLIATSIKDVFKNYGIAVIEELKNVSLALLPIFVFTIIFNFFIVKTSKLSTIRNFVGLFYSLIGLTIFLTGAKAGFMPVGTLIGEYFGSSSSSFMIIILGAIMGFFVVMAEPAVHVLNNQVEEVTGGAISKTKMLFSLAIGVAIAIALAYSRVVFEYSIWWILIPGYLIAFGLMFFVPKVFSSIAFDSGGVASGPMTASFMMPIALGACSILNQDSILDYGFGVVALVALTPLIVVQIMGLSYNLRKPHILYGDKKRYEDIIILNVPEMGEVIYE